MDIRDKIKKLLALGTSPNENEAKAAILKAKELMAKNKLSEADFEDQKNMEIVHLVCESAKWTTDSGRIWMVNLCKMLCDNYCCVSAWNCARGHRTFTLVISGLRDDVELCKSVIEYAVGFINSSIKVLERKYGRISDTKSIASSYANGFIVGMEMAFEEQKEEHQEWGLVMVKPDEVRDYEESLGNRAVRSKKADFNPMAYMKGQNDGMQFNAQKVLQG